MGRNVVTRRLSVGTNVMRLAAENPKRKSILVYNNGTATIYILASGNQTKDEGIPVPAGGSFKDTVSTGELWVVADSGTQDIRVMTVGE